MRTFVAEGVLEDYTSGLIVIKAKNEKIALKLLKEKFDGYRWDEIETNLRELNDNEIVYVYGGA